MSHELEQLRDAALAEIAAAADEQTLEAARVRYLGRAGSISAWADRMKSLSKEERPVVGKLLNERRNVVTAAIEQPERFAPREYANSRTSTSLPDRRTRRLHPLTQCSIGISILDGCFRARGGSGRRKRVAIASTRQHRARSSSANEMIRFICPTAAFSARTPRRLDSTMETCAADPLIAPARPSPR